MSRFCKRFLHFLFFSFNTPYTSQTEIRTESCHNSRKKIPLLFYQCFGLKRPERLQFGPGHIRPNLSVCNKIRDSVYKKKHISIKNYTVKNLIQSLLPDNILINIPIA